MLAFAIGLHELARGRLTRARAAEPGRATRSPRYRWRRWRSAPSTHTASPGCCGWRAPPGCGPWSSSRLAAARGSAADAMALAPAGGAGDGRRARRRGDRGRAGDRPDDRLRELRDLQPVGPWARQPLQSGSRRWRHSESGHRATFGSTRATGRRPPSSTTWAGLLGLAALAYGLIWWLDRGERAVPSALAVAAALVAYAHFSGTPYQEAKSIMLASPLAMLIAARALLSGESAIQLGGSGARSLGGEAARWVRGRVTIR